MQRFIVKQYDKLEPPTLKGNGFDGLPVGDNRTEAEEFIAFVNHLIDFYVINHKDNMDKVN